MNFNATLIGQMITFGLLVLFTMKYVWPPIIQAMQDRQKRIADGLASAERGSTSRNWLRPRPRRCSRKPNSKPPTSLPKPTSAPTKSSSNRNWMPAPRGSRQFAAAQTEIEQEINRAREQLRGQVVNLAVAGAGKILKARGLTKRPMPPCWMIWSRSSNHTDHANG